MSRLSAWLKWLYPGMHVKRWVLLGVAGACLALVGLAVLTRGQPLDALAYANRALAWAWSAQYRSATRGVAWTAIGASMLTAGALTVGFAGFRFVQSLTAGISPSVQSPSLIDTMYRNRYLSQGPNVVVLGGGTGLSTMLRGLKQYTSNIVAVVTVTDDGGSSGKLTRQLNILPPGDIRNCLVALADSEAVMTDLFQYRFRGDGAGEGLRDHAFGNLLIAALTDISSGDFEEAVQKTSRVLNIRGRVLPSTLTSVKLRGEMDDGSVIVGETNIVTSRKRIKRISLDPADTAALDEVITAIEVADIVAIGPGSVFTSVIPNLLVRGIPEALHRSRARKVYVCNVMTQPGETDGFTASDHLKAIQAHVPRLAIDCALVNNGLPSVDLLDAYRKVGAVLVEADTDRIRRMGCKPILGRFVSQSDVVRHDPGALAVALMRMVGAPAAWNRVRR